MEDQGKRLLVAVAIAFAIMIGWSFLFPPEQVDEKPPETPTEATGPVQPGSPTAPVQPGQPAAVAPGTDAPPASRGAEKEVALEFDNFRATFSTYGAALKSWQLLGEQFYDGERSIPEDLVRSETEALWPFQVSFPGSTHTVPPGAEWTIVKQGASEVLFRHQAGGLEVTKHYVIHPADYLVELTVEAKVTGGAARQNLVVSLGSVQDPKDIQEGGMAQVGREWKAACFANEELSTWSAKNLAGRSKEVGGDVNWFGFTYPYFMVAAALEPRDERVTCRATGPSADAGPMLVEAIYSPVDLQEGAVYQRRVAGYLGPKYMGKLDAVAGILGWEDTGFDKSIDLGWLGFLAGPLLWLLTFFHGLVNNWPLSIVLLTITVKLATLYWTHKSMKSMKAMARLKPELEKIKEKYKDDRQRQQVETMNLFKAHGVNPLAGCLPMLLQMPIWFALYKALSVAAELYQAPFVWISDLTAPDPYFILPVFMTAMMLLQALLTPTTATGMQQKMLTWGMPIIFGAMSLFFPAGLTLYISTNSILTLLHHLYMRAEDKKATPPGEQVAAAAKGAAAKPAGGKIIDVTASDETDGDGDGDGGGGGGVAPTTRPRNGVGGGRKRSKGRGGRRRGAHS
jgi:YidC/Oxa1 family membrane protein insertase